MPTKTLIVGAGLTGLILANALKNQNVTLIEKSRGVGGRMATRRTETAKFDHGAQFYRLRDEIKACHEIWLKSGHSQLWFEQDGIQHFKAAGGITTLAKDLAATADVQLEERVTQIERVGENWRVKFESGKLAEGVDQIILTCPLPQALDILKASNIAFDPVLTQTSYSKALIALIETTSDLRLPNNGYQEFKNDELFSIADQKQKGVSKTSAITVTLAAVVSEKFYEASDELVTQEVLRLLEMRFPGFKHSAIQIKRWRYAQVVKSVGHLFAQPAPNLYLAGDSFGGASLNGAARSANALAQNLNSNS